MSRRPGSAGRRPARDRQPPTGQARRQAAGRRTGAGGVGASQAEVGNVSQAIGVSYLCGERVAQPCLLGMHLLSSMGKLALVTML